MVKPNSQPKSRSRQRPAKSSLGAEERILAAARLEFGRQGFAGARMQSIADAAGVQKALIHYYFRNKQRLYQAAFTDAFARVWSTLSASMGSLPADADLRSIVRTFATTYIGLIRANPDFPMMLLREVTDGGAAIEQAANAIAGAHGNMPAQLHSLLLRALAQPGVRPYPPFHLILSMVAMTAAPFLLAPFVQIVAGKALGRPLAFDDDFFEERIESITTLVCDGLLSARETSR